MLLTALVIVVGGSGGGGMLASDVVSPVLRDLVVLAAGAAIAFSVMRRFLFSRFGDEASVAGSSVALRFLDFAGDGPAAAFSFTSLLSGEGFSLPARVVSFGEEEISDADSCFLDFGAMFSQD